MKSIISNEKKCIVCENTLNLHKHHLYFGVANRKLSEKYGCWVYLCHKHHNGSNEGVHFNRELDLYLKRVGQLAFEKNYKELDFLKVFGKSYL